MGGDNKKKFMQKPENAIQMRAEAIPGVIKHYADKYKINIILNGETKYGRDILRVHDENANKFKGTFDNENSKYSHYIQNFWRPFNVYKGIGEFDISPNTAAFMAQYANLEKLISKYLDVLGRVKENLSVTDISELNKIIATSGFKELFDEKIDQLKKTFKSNECLTESEAKKEIKSIQESLKDGEYVGYMYTNNNRIMADHFEVLVISKSNIVKPISWEVSPDKIINVDYFEGATSDIKNFVSSIKVDGMVTKYFSPHPQASTIECGPLGMLYLKELLKNNAKELRESSLIIPFYNKNNSAQNLFFPAASLLRYSQSGGYNKAIESMLMSDSKDSITVTYNKETQTITPIRAILEKTKMTAIEKNNNEMVAKCDELLKQLPDFRKKWMSEYEKAIKMRDQMQDKTNQYLSYKSVRFYKIANPNGKSEETSQSLKPDLNKNVDAAVNVNSKMPSKPTRLAEFSKIRNELDGLEEFSATMENVGDGKLAGSELKIFRKSMLIFEKTNDIEPLQSFMDDLNEKKPSDTSSDLKEFYELIKIQANNAMVTAKRVLSLNNDTSSNNEAAEASDKSPKKR